MIKSSQNRYFHITKGTGICIPGAGGYNPVLISYNSDSEKVAFIPSSGAMDVYEFGDGGSFEALVQVSTLTRAAIAARYFFGRPKLPPDNLKEIIQSTKDIWSKDNYDYFVALTEPLLNLNLWNNF